MAELIALEVRDLEEWRDVRPDRSTLPEDVRRIIMHWTAGTHAPNDVDRAAYHFLATGPDGVIVRGVQSVDANLRRPLRTGKYAPHTGGMNTGSVGVAACGMRASDPTAGKFGPYPITERQLHRFLAFCGMLAVDYGLDPRNPAHLFTHREAFELHGVEGQANRTKLDWVRLPPVPGVVGWKECGAWMRDVAGEYAELVRLLDAGAATVRPLGPVAPAVRELRTWALTTGALRVRPSPGTAGAPVATLPARSFVAVDGVTLEGENVLGSRTWYRLRADGAQGGRWVWAGATDLPVAPSVPAGGVP